MPKCKVCKEKFTPRFSSFQKVCEKPSCIVALHEATKKKEWEAEKKQRIERLMTHGDYEGLLQAEMNKMARLIDKGCRCISCGREAKKPQGGHLRSVGSSSNIRFNLENIWLQCYSCNEEKSGNVNGYDDGLIKLFGKEYHEHVKYNLMRVYPILKLTIDELKEKISIARKINKELEKLDLAYPLEMRRKLRKTLNERMGMYPNQAEK